MLTTLRRLLRADSPRTRRPRPARARLGVEALEDRAVPSAVPFEATFDVATGLGTFPEYGRTIARADNGNFAETWRGNDGLYVRLYNSGGTPLTAAQKVAGTTYSDDRGATIAMSPRGQFVVAWTHEYSPTDLDVRAQLYNASGIAVGGNFGVATTGLNEGGAAAGMDAAGNFAVAYGYGPGDVRARQFNSSGGFVREVVVANGPKRELSPSLDMNPAGQFVVSYTLDYTLENDAYYDDDHDVWAARYGPSGNLIASTQVASSYLWESASSAAIDDAGDVVVSYSRDENNTLRVYAQRVATSGWNLGAPIALPMPELTSQGLGDTSHSSVDMDHLGNFVVAYENHSRASNILAQQFGWNGAAQSGTISVTSGTTTQNVSASVAVGNGGRFVVNYLAQEGVQSPAFSLRTQIYYTPVSNPPPIFNPNPWPVYLP